MLHIQPDLEISGHECATTYWNERSMSRGTNAVAASLPGANAQCAGKQNFNGKVKLILEK
jgi:hypothetical protein